MTCSNTSCLKRVMEINDALNSCNQIKLADPLIFGMFEQQAILHIDDVSDEQIRAVFKDAAKLS